MNDLKDDRPPTRGENAPSTADSSVPCRPRQEAGSYSDKRGGSR
jgi:hypothetical protein